ncbi:MAG: ABC transporter ATP-binding protein [Ignavibacterium sp.]
MFSDKIIEVKNLTKRFKEITAVNGLNFSVYAGDVFGFLGPNGAGKSTTIRMLLSLIFPSKGEIYIFGKSLFHSKKEILKNIGAIVEKPDFYGYLTAYKNLEILSKLYGITITKNQIMDLLDFVGLVKRANSKVKTFSHGMKQRLGIAQALLHNPELIILDEPSTGLDPQGMKEIRDLIIHLSKEKNKTILLSSHILNEVEQVANRMIIINKGKTIVEGNVSDLLNNQKVKVIFEFTDSQLENIKQILSTTYWNETISNFDKNKIAFLLSQNEIPILNKYLVENEINISSIIPIKSLEEYFLKITESN